MARYQVQHPYRAFRDGTHYGPWTPGEVVELDQDVAEWVNRDSPGALTEHQEEAPAIKREMPSTPNRQHKGSKTR